MSEVHLTLQQVEIAVYIGAEYEANLPPSQSERRVRL
jgi:hypothetical protein